MAHPLNGNFRQTGRLQKRLSNSGNRFFKFCTAEAVAQIGSVDFFSSVCNPEMWSLWVRVIKTAPRSLRPNPKAFRFWLTRRQEIPTSTSSRPPVQLNSRALPEDPLANVCTVVKNSTFPSQATPREIRDVFRKKRNQSPISAASVFLAQPIPSSSPSSGNSTARISAPRAWSLATMFS